MACTFYEFQSSLFGGDYWCKKDNCRVSDDIYYRYCRGYSYSDCPIYKRSQSSGGCFITTATCQILGFDDHAPIMDNLRKFRKDILRKNEKYYNTLKEYDVIGPMLSDCLMNDKNKEEMAFCFYQSTVLPVNEFINQGNYDAAVLLYTTSTKALIEYYGLMNQYCDIRSRDYDYEGFEPELAGCGKKKLRTLKESL